MLTRIARTWDALRAAWTGPLTLKSPELARLMGAHPVSSGVSIDEHTAMTIAAVWSAVALIADDVASLPLMLYRRLPTGGKDRFESHRLYRLLHDTPNIEMTSMVWRRTIQAHALVWGNGYCEIQRDSAGRPVSIWPITPDRVTPWRNERGQLVYRVMNDGRTESLLAPENMLHIPGMGFDGIQGYSVIAKARESLGLGLAAERFGATFFGNGSTFGGIITYPEMKTSITESYLENNRKAIEARHQGLDRAHKFLTLYGGAKYEKLGIPPNDAQFLETRVFQIRDVARWFKMPPHKLGDLADATYSNVEQMDLAYYKSCLRPWLELWEQELSRKLIAPLERTQQFIEHVREGFLSADTAGRSEFYGKLFAIGAITINEIRDRENLDPIPGGDTPFVPLNMMPLNRADEYVSAQIASLQAKTESLEPQSEETDTDEGEIDDSASETDQEDSSTGRAVLAAIDSVRETITQTGETWRKDAEARALAEARAQEAERDREDAIKQWATIQQAYDAARSDVERLQAMTDRMVERHEVETWKGTAEERAKELEAVVQARDLAAQTIQGLETQIEAWKTRMLSLEQEVSESKLSLDLLRSEHASMHEAQRKSEETVMHLESEVASSSEERERLQQAIDRAHAENEALRAKHAEQETARRHAAVAARRAIYVEAMARLVRREIMAAKQYQATGPKLRSWLDHWYDADEASLWTNALLPGLKLHSTVSSVEDLREMAEQIIHEHFSTSRRDILAVLDAQESYGELLKKRLDRWASDRAEHYADALIQRELSA